MKFAPLLAAALALFSLSAPVLAQTPTGVWTSSFIM